MANNDHEKLEIANFIAGELTQGEHPMLCELPTVADMLELKFPQNWMSESLTLRSISETCVTLVPELLSAQRLVSESILWLCPAFYVPLVLSFAKKLGDQPKRLVDGLFRVLQSNSDCHAKVAEKVGVLLDPMLAFNDDMFQWELEETPLIHMHCVSVSEKAVMRRVPEKLMRKIKPDESATDTTFEVADDVNACEKGEKVYTVYASFEKLRNMAFFFNEWSMSAKPSNEWRVSAKPSIEYTDQTEPTPKPLASDGQDAMGVHRDRMDGLNNEAIERAVSKAKDAILEELRKHYTGTETLYSIDPLDMGNAINSTLSTLANEIEAVHHTTWKTVTDLEAKVADVQGVLDEHMKYKSESEMHKKQLVEEQEKHLQATNAIEALKNEIRTMQSEYEKQITEKDAEFEKERTAMAKYFNDSLAIMKTNLRVCMEKLSSNKDIMDDELSSLSSLESSPEREEAVSATKVPRLNLGSPVQMIDGTTDLETEKESKPAAGTLPERTTSLAFVRQLSENSMFTHGQLSGEDAIAMAKERNLLVHTAHPSDTNEEAGEILAPLPANVMNGVPLTASASVAAAAPVAAAVAAGNAIRNNDYLHTAIDSLHGLAKQKDMAEVRAVSLQNKLDLQDKDLQILRVELEAERLKNKLAKAESEHVKAPVADTKEAMTEKMMAKLQEQLQEQLQAQQEQLQAQMVQMKEQVPNLLQTAMKAMEATEEARNDDNGSKKEPKQSDAALDAAKSAFTKAEEASSTFEPTPM